MAEIQASGFHRDGHEGRGRHAGSSTSLQEHRTSRPVDDGVHTGDAREIQLPLDDLGHLSCGFGSLITDVGGSRQTGLAPGVHRRVVINPTDGADLNGREHSRSLRACDHANRKFGSGDELLDDRHVVIGVGIGNGLGEVNGVFDLHHPQARAAASSRKTSWGRAAC